MVNATLVVFIKRNKIKIPAFFSFFLIIVSCFAISVGADQDSSPLPDMNGIECAYVINLESGVIVASKDADKNVYPSSSTKLMSAYIAYQSLASRLSEKIEITAELISGTVGNRYGLTTDDIVTVRDLFYIAFAGGYNDAVMALARLSCGDIETFVAQMNSKAIELGMTSTKYTNPIGMHDRFMRTTASDVAKVAAVLSENEFFLTVTSDPKYTLEGPNKQYTVKNRNDLVTKLSGSKYYNPLCRGMSFGMTEESGYSLTTVAKDKGTSYLCVIMGGKTADDGTLTAYTVANELIEWSFKNYSYREVLSTKKAMCELPVEMSAEVDKVLLVPSESFSYYLPTSAIIGEDITFTVRLTVDSIEAPFSEGIKCGSVLIFYKDKLISTVPLVTQAAVERSELLYQMEQIREFSQSRVFIATIVSAVIITITYFAIGAVIRARSSKKHHLYF